MPGSMHDVLFRLIGDEDDARRSLEVLAAELEAFAKINAEAEADVDTDQARTRIKALKAELEELSATTAEPDISTDIAGVVAQITTLELMLRKLDGEDVDIDVDVDSDLITRKLASIVTQTNLVSRAAQKATGETKSFAQRILDSTVNIGPFTTQVRVLGPLIAILASVVTALVAALAALASSLAYAVAALGALGVAAGGVVTAIGGLAFAAVQRFQQQANKAGTAAHFLAQQFKEVQGAAKTLLPAADPVLRALGESARELVGLIKQIKPAFMDFGRAAGQALTPLTNALGSPEIARGISNLLRLAGDVLRPMVRVGVQLGRIFLNIAQAAMPFLADGMRGLAQTLKGVADGTSNITGLSLAIGTLVDHLKVWLDLGWQVLRVFGNLFRALAPAGKELATWLTQGAKALADWLGSSEGMARVKSFMADMVPLAKEIITFFGKLVVTILELGQAAAPALTPIFQALNDILDAINWLLDAFNSLPAPIRQIVGAALALLLPFSKLRLIVAAIVAGWNALRTAASAVGNAIKTAFTAAFNAIKTAAGAVATFVAGVWRRLVGIVTTVGAAIVNAARAVWTRVKAVVSAVLGAIVAFVRARWNMIKSIVTAVGRAILGAARAVWNAIKGVVQGALNAIKGVVQAGWNAIKSAVSSALSAIKNAVSTGFNAVKSIISGAIDAAVGVVESAANLFYEAGKQLILSLADGIKAVAEAPINAIEGIMGKVQADLPGSEPKNKNSPLYGLGERGKAIIHNLVAGLEEAGPLLAKSLANQLAPVGARMPQATTSTSTSEVNQTFAVDARGSGLRGPDARLLAAQLGALLRTQGVQSPT